MDATEAGDNIERVLASHRNPIRIQLITSDEFSNLVFVFHKKIDRRLESEIAIAVGASFVDVRNSGSTARVIVHYF